MLAIFGRGGVVLVSSLVTVAAFSSLNGIMLASPRIFVAMAEDRLLFPALAGVHPRLETPHWAILLAAFLGTTLAINQTFERLTNTFVLAMWPFYALTVAAIYRLRRRRSDLGRSRRTFGYPVVPAIFILSVVWFVLNALVTDPIPTGLTFALICTGLPVYEIVKRRDLAQSGGHLP
jgi:APA family basic amino acid/polyamine antiporter